MLNHWIYNICTLYVCLYVFVDIYDEAQNVNKAFNLSCLVSPFSVFTMLHAIVAHILTTTSPSPDDHNSPIPPVNIQFTQNININTFYKQDTFKNIVFPILQDKGCFIHFLHICARDKVSHTKKNKYSLVASSGVSSSGTLWSDFNIEQFKLVKTQ